MKNAGSLSWDASRQYKLAFFFINFRLATPLTGI